jgi:hypothetical protein
MEITRTTALGLCAALFLSVCSSHAAAPPANATVILTAWLHVDDLSMTDVVVEVEVNGTVHLAAVAENGRVTVSLPLDAEAVLRFEKPGYVSKEVTVDTRHVHRGGSDQRKRKISFAVILEAERRMGGLTYAGPVGVIGFDPAGGYVAVTHDRQLVPARRHTPMVF